MISLKQVNKIMLKIFSVMEKINEFSNQMAGSGLPSDYGKEKTKRKVEHKKQKLKNKKEKKKLREAVAKPEILGGFDCKGIGDRMMDEFQRPHKDKTEENQ